MKEDKTLTVNDLLQIQQIIDVAVQRGAFKAEESRVVGETYEKIGAFLASLSPDEKQIENETKKETNQND